MNLSPTDHTKPHIDAERARGEHTAIGHAHADHPHSHPTPAMMKASQPVNSLLGWPAWQRVLLVLPLLVLLWLAVVWASAEVA